jgi:hypothetical protein
MSEWFLERMSFLGSLPGSVPSLAASVPRGGSLSFAIAKPSEWGSLVSCRKPAAHLCCFPSLPPLPPLWCYKVWAQDFAFDRQALYHLSHTSSPLFFFLKTGSCYVAPTGLEFMMTLPPPPECCDCRHVLLYQVLVEHLFFICTILLLLNYTFSVPLRFFFFWWGLEQDSLVFFFYMK